MEEVEVHIITRRDLPPKLLETFNRQTYKDFTLNIMTRYPQKWESKELNLDFPLRVRCVELAYSSGTKYASSLAHNEALCYVESKYVLFLDDFVVITSIALEKFMSWADESLWMSGGIKFGDKAWSPEEGRLIMEMLEEAARQFDPSYHPVPYQGDVNKMNPVEAFDIFPMEALKRINGWDLAFDHGWGQMDVNLGQRLVRAGFKYAYVPGLCCYHFQHFHHTQEVDDERVSSEDYAYNKVTGAKIPIKRIRDAYGYQDYCKAQGMIEAPVGFREVLRLLRGG